MKKNIIYTASVAFSVFISASAIAQNGYKQSYEGDITITPLELQQRGDSLYVDIDFKMNGVSVDSRRSADFIPILVAPTKTKELPKVSLKGRNNYKNYSRTLALMSKKQKADYAKTAPYDVVKGYKHNSDTLSYRYVLPYEPWMAEAHLDMQKDACGCGHANMLAMQRLVDKVSLEKVIILEPYQITPSLAYVRPVVEAVKIRDIQTKASLDFAVNKTDIRPEYMNNPLELAKIRKMIDDLTSDKNISIKTLEIIGYASPEGSLETNKRLSERRAIALRDYLTSIYTFPRNSYYITFGGENWDGLVEELNASNYGYKDEVIAIIDYLSIEEGREKAIMNLKGGVPYRQMLKDIFPKLRVAICKVDYSIKNFTIEEAVEEFETRPQNLSLNELYMVANQYDKGSQEFNDVFETAARMYPKDDIACLNAASAALARNEIATAERYLDKVTSKVRIPEYDNSRGVLEMLKGNYDKAEQYFNSAKNAGLTVAQINLDELTKKRENIKQLEEYKNK